MRRLILALLIVAQLVAAQSPAPIRDAWTHGAVDPNSGTAGDRACAGVDQEVPLVRMPFMNLH